MGWAQKMRASRDRNPPRATPPGSLATTRRAIWVAGAVALIAVVALAGGRAEAQQAPAAEAAPKKAPVKRAAQKAPSKKTETATAKPTMTREDANRLFEAGTAAQAAGKGDDAVKNFTQAISGGALDAPQVARALAKRGAVYTVQGKSAAAIGDLSQAIYLGGLPDAERAEARQNRGTAYQAAGMTDLAEADFKVAKAGGGADPRRQTAAVQSGVSSSSTGSAGGQGSGQGSGLGGFFGGLFGGSPAPAAVAPVAVAAPQPQKPAAVVAPPASAAASPITTASVAVAPAAAAKVASVAPPLPPASISSSAPAASSGAPDSVGSFFGGLFGGGSSAAPGATMAIPPASRSESAAVSSGSATTAVSASKPEFAPGVTKGSQPKALRVASGPAPGPAKTSGKVVRVQIASVRSEEQAKQLIEQIGSANQALTGGREPRIEKTVLGNMGTFYQVQLGPFANEEEGQKACPQLRGRGLDCMIVR